MTLRLQSLLTGIFALFAVLHLALAPASANPMSGGYQLFERAASGISADIQLASLGNFAPSPETASEYANVPNTGVTDFIDGITVVDIRTGQTFTGTIDLRPTLFRVDNGIPHPHRNDGSIFNNRPLSGQITPELPVQPNGYYTEYVHPTPGISGAGPQRIVTGNGGEIYYTPDHYQTFIRLDQ